MPFSSDWEYFTTADGQGKKDYMMSSSSRSGQDGTTSWLRSNDRSTLTFQDYPPNQPFIYDNYRRDPNKPIKAYPESNRKDILSALKNLQDKIRRIELEDGRRHGDTYESQRSTHESRMIQVNGTAQTEEKSMMTDEVHLKLDAGQKRCHLLEKQLDDMRKMLQQAEVDRSEALRKSALLRDSQSSSKLAGGRSQGEKLVELEREQLRLMAMQTLAASQIQELEEQLQMERHYRKMMQNKAAELESAAEANRIMLESNRCNKTTTKKKKRAASAGKSPSGRRPTARKRHPTTNAKPTSEHYRLNLAEIPFINGRSTGRSYSLSANFQEVLSLMKSHTPRLCRVSHATPRASTQHRTTDDDCENCTCERDDDDDTEAETDKTLRNSSLSQLLVQLQDEFGHMSFEHKELLHQIQEANDQHVRDDLERELDCLVARMEVKSDQITRLRRYQEMMVKKRRKASKSKTPVSRPTSASVSRNSRSVKGPKKAKPSATGVSPGVSKAQGSLNLLKDLKRIQTSLRADDIVWDC